MILSKFQPAMVLLSGFISPCPLPSPAVTLRVNSTVLTELTLTTKVRELTEVDSRCCIHAWIHVELSGVHVICLGLQWPVKGVIQTWMIQLSVTMEAFSCDTSCVIILRGNNLFQIFLSFKVKMPLFFFFVKNLNSCQQLTKSYSQIQTCKLYTL